MHMFLSTRLPQHGQHAEEAVVCCDGPACASRECHQRLQTIPACIVKRCGVLSSLLETAGCAALPFEASQVLLWLNFRKQRLACSPEPELTPHDILAASQVAEFLQDEELPVLIGACATQLILTKRTSAGFASVPQISLAVQDVGERSGIHASDALLRDVLQQLARKSSLSAVLQQVSGALLPHTVAACVRRRALRLPDAFATLSEMELFLEHINPHPPLLTQLQLSSTSGPGIRIPHGHPSIPQLSRLLSSQSQLHTLDMSGVTVPRAPRATTPPDAPSAAVLRLGPLQLPRSIRHLALARCELSHHPIATLQRICTSLHQLSYLDISHNALGVLGMSALAPSLRALSALATLDISSNGVRREGAVALAPHLATLTALTALHMASNVLQAAGIAALAEALPSLPLLATLDISGSVFSDAGALPVAATLPRLPSLCHLDLAWSALCDSGVANLRPGLTSPRAHPPLEEPPTATSTPPLPAGLTFLSLRNNNFTSGATGDLCVLCAPLARTLRHLDLSCNRLRWGVGVLAATLTRLSELRELLLRDTCMRTSDVALLAPALATLKHLRHVDVSGNQLSTPLGVLLDSVTRKHQEGSGERCGGPGSDARAAPLLDTFWGVARTSEAAELLSRRGSGSSSGLHAAGACRAAGGDQSRMAVNTSITHLNLSSGFDSENMEGQDIAAMDVPPVVHDLVREIVNRAVEELAFGSTSGHSAHRAWSPPAVSFPNLRVLDLSGTSDALPAVSGLLLHCGGALESLNLARVGLTASMARTLCQPLSQCTRLTHLDLSHNSCMGAAGGSALCEAMCARMPSLHVLSLAMCGVGGAVIAEACIARGSRTAALWGWAPTALTASDRRVSNPVHAVHAVLRTDPSAATQPAHSRRAAVGCSTDDATGHVTNTDMVTRDASGHECARMHGGECKGCTQCISGTGGMSHACTGQQGGCSDGQLVSSTSVEPAQVECTSSDSAASGEGVGCMHAHGADAGCSRRRESAPAAVCCVTEVVGSSSTMSAASKHAAQSSGCREAGACMQSAGQPQQQRQQRRCMLQIQSLNLKGVALGQTVGVEVLRELVRCAPRLRKLDVGGSQLAEGEGIAGVRGALDALTQVTLLGLSGVTL